MGQFLTYIKNLSKEWILWLSVIGVLVWWGIGAFFVSEIALPQELYWLIAFGGVVWAAFRLDRQKQALIEANTLELFINPTSSPVIPPIADWMRLQPEGDLSIRFNLEIRNPNSTPLLFSLGATLEYNGALFGTEITRIGFRRPSQSGYHSPDKIGIGEQSRMENCSLEIVVPRQFSSFEEFLQKLFNSEAKEYKINLSIDIENLHGTRSSLEPIQISGDFRALLNNTFDQLVRRLLHSRTDQETQMLLKPITDLMEDYYSKE